MSYTKDSVIEEMNRIIEMSQALCKETTGHEFIAGKCVHCGALCEDCHGTGYITVDTFNGEHDQYQSLCECMLPTLEESDNYDPSEQYARNKYAHQ